MSAASPTSPAKSFPTTARTTSVRAAVAPIRPPGETMRMMSAAQPQPDEVRTLEAAAPPGRPRRRARSSAVMAAGTLVSRFLGFAKTWMLALALGLGSTVTDTFINATNLPNLIFLLVAGGVFNAVWSRRSSRPARARTGPTTSAACSPWPSSCCCPDAGGDAAGAHVIDLTTQGYSPQQKSLAVAFAFWCLPQIFFYGLYALLTQVLNANGAFGPAMWAPILNNVVAIAGSVCSSGSSAPTRPTRTRWTTGDPSRRCWWRFSTIGVVAQTAILMIPVLRLRLGLRPRSAGAGWGWDRPPRSSVWTLATAAVGQLPSSTSCASRPSRRRTPPAPGRRTDRGGRHASRQTPCWRWPASCTCCRTRSSPSRSPTVLFNRMTRASQDGDRAGLRRALSHGLRTMAVATVFGALPSSHWPARWACSSPAVTGRTGSCCPDPDHPGPQHPFMSANFMMSRVFYANGTPAPPFYIQLVWPW